MPGHAVVVGAGPGLGLAIARAFGSAGLEIALVARDEPDLGELVAALEADGTTAGGVAAEIGSPESLRAGLREIAAARGVPSVVVYNPSAWVEGPPTALSYDEFVAGLRVGVAGFVVVLNELGTAMAAAGRGTILTTNSGAALKPTAASAALSAQKAALRAVTAGAAEELAPAGVHVATVLIDGFLKPGTKFDPALIAPVYLELHRERRDAWRGEVIYR